MFRVAIPKMKMTIPLLEAQINYPTYRKFFIAKKRGGRREICSPEGILKIIQKELNYSLQAYYSCIRPNESYGFVTNSRHLKNFCNIVKNAKVHVGKQYVLNIDLKDFFSNISAKQVKELFLSHYFNFTEEISIALTLLTTYKGSLPTGAPTSPVISNFICLKLDAELRTFCDENELRFSRYADDLTFSSDIKFSEEIVSKIRFLIEENGFIINYKKWHIKSKNQR
ncbi:MAG: reverse transcriptase family protein [Capnocytophaga felis]|nr:reverse transcriptase family protein [Capnocytophaga felis]